MDSTSTTFQSYGERSSPAYSKPVISTSVVPVEVFVLFIIYNTSRFTICDLITLFEKKHRIKLQFSRMQQIAQDLVAAGKVYQTRGINAKKRQIAYYSFSKIV